MYSAAVVAEELGYDSFSQFVNDLIREAVAAVELSRTLDLRDKASRRKFTLEYVFSKVKSMLLHR